MLQQIEKVLGYPPLTMRVDGVTIYGLHAYGSMFDMKINRRKEVHLPQARRVYNFKKHGSNRELFTELIRQFGNAADTDTVIAIPSSSAGRMSLLQEIFGETLKRVKDVEQRKYNHHLPVDDDGSVILEADVKGRRVLLVDDIVTTGASMLFFRKMLMKEGASVIPLGVGLSFAKADTYPDADAVEEIVRRFSLPQVADDEPMDFESVLNEAVGGLYESLGATEITLSSSRVKALKEAAGRMGTTPEKLLAKIVDDFLRAVSSNG